MKAYPGQSGTGLVLYDAWAVPGVITDMCCLLKFTGHYPQPPDLSWPTRYALRWGERDGCSSATKGDCGCVK